MTTTTTTETVEHLPLEAIIPDPGNRKIVLDAQFVGSIRTHGVIQPLLVSPHPDEQGRYHLVAGHRRLGAARKIGLDTVPALVRTLSEQERLELGLSTTSNARTPTRGPGTGHGPASNTACRSEHSGKRIGRSAAYVRDRLKLLELPVTARRLVDEDVITIEQGLVLVRLVDHPEVLEATLAQIGDHHGNIEWLVDSALRRIDSDAKVAEGRAKAEGKGLRIVEHEGHQPSGYVEVATYGGLDVDAKAHAKEPCHAVVISPRDGALTPVCTDRKRHTRKGASTSRAPPRPGPTTRPGRRRRPSGRRPSTGGSSSPPAVPPPVEGRRAGPVLPNYLDDANSIEQAAVAKLLGLEPAPEAGSHDRWGDALRDYTAPPRPTPAGLPGLLPRPGRGCPRRRLGLRAGTSPPGVPGGQGLRTDRLRGRAGRGHPRPQRGGPGPHRRVPLPDRAQRRRPAAEERRRGGDATPTPKRDSENDDALDGTPSSAGQRTSTAATSERRAPRRAHRHPAHRCQPPALRGDWGLTAAPGNRFPPESTPSLARPGGVTVPKENRPCGSASATPPAAATAARDGRRAGSAHLAAPRWAWSCAPTATARAASEASSTDAAPTPTSTPPPAPPTPSRRAGAAQALPLSEPLLPARRGPYPAVPHLFKGTSADQPQAGARPLTWRGAATGRSKQVRPGRS